MSSQGKTASSDAESPRPVGTSHDGTPIEKLETSVSVAQDVESIKPGAAVEVRLGDGGARTAELMQSSWGKHGKLWIFLGLGLCMLA